MTLVGMFSHIHLAEHIDTRIKDFRREKHAWPRVCIFSEEIELIGSTWEKEDILLYFQYVDEEILHIVRTDTSNPLLELILRI